MTTSALIPDEASLDKFVLYAPLACGQANAAPEWQARTWQRRLGIDGGLSTRGACYPFVYAVTLF